MKWDEPKMSNTTAGVWFGTTDDTPAHSTTEDTTGGLGELQGLVRRIIAALDEAPLWQSMAFVGKQLGDTSDVYVVPDIDWEMPAPEWPEFDYTVPAC